LCSSGTAAVELALRGLKVGEGDEVILAAYDFKANFQNVLCVGATAVLVDIRPDDWQMDVAKVEQAISQKTRAIVASHLHGGQVDMQRLAEISKRHQISVIEDACQMPGATVQKQIAGSWGDVGILSFGGSKLLSAGRGGAFFTNNEEIVQRAKLYTHRGNEAYPLSELQAAVLIPQWDRLDERNEYREKNIRYLTEKLQSETSLVPFESRLADSRPGYYKLGLQYDSSNFAGLSREQFCLTMRADGVNIAKGFRSLHSSHSARRYKTNSSLKNADLADKGILVLHHPVLLCEEKVVSMVVKAVKKAEAHAEELTEFLTGSC